MERKIPVRAHRRTTPSGTTGVSACQRTLPDREGEARERMARRQAEAEQHREEKTEE